MIDLLTRSLAVLPLGWQTDILTAYWLPDLDTELLAGRSTNRQTEGRVD